MPRFRASERDADGLDDLEELGDDAIIAQQTSAHAPRPRASVSDESRSVVIADHQRQSAERRPKCSGEATLVIRDRRALDDLRSSILLGKAKKTRRRRALYVWGALGLTAFILGGISAFLATDTLAESPPGKHLRPSEPPESPVTLARASTPLPPASQAAPSPDLRANRRETVRAVRLDELPVEPPARR